MKINLFGIMLFLLLLINYGCNRCSGSVTDANFIIHAKDFYTNEPIKNAQVNFRRYSPEEPIKSLLTDDKGLANARIKFSTPCELNPSFTLNLKQPDTSTYFPVNLDSKSFFSEIKGDVNISILYKKKSANILLHIIHTKIDTDSLDIRLDWGTQNGTSYGIPQLFLDSKLFTTKGLYDTTHLVKVFPEENISFSYSYLNAMKQRTYGNLYTLKTNKTDTFKFEIIY
jgi:hypothetical protein